MWFVCLLFTDPSVLRGAFVGHTDAVWGLVYSGTHQRLLSCSADGTVRLWKATEVAPALNVFNDNQGTEFSTENTKYSNWNKIQVRHSEVLLWRSFENEFSLLPYGGRKSHFKNIRGFLFTPVLFDFTVVCIDTL